MRKLAQVAPRQPQTNRVRSMSHPDDLMTLAACARALADKGDEISRQGLSQYCDDHKLKISTPNGPRVSFSAVRNHRLQNYDREIMTGGKRLEADPQRVILPANDAPEAPADAAPSGSNVFDISPAQRLKELQVEKAEMENAKLCGDLVLIDEVTAGVADAVVQFRQQLFQAVPDAAQVLSAELGLAGEEERAVRAAMKNMVRDGLKGLVSAVASSNAALTNESANEVQGRIGRLTVLAAYLRHRPEKHIDRLQERFA